MNWMGQLSKVYDNHKDHVGVFEERRNQRITLLPVSHVMQSAQIEILVSPEGQFVNAKVVDKENARTIVPATTASANRASASAPHYMHDKLSYVAGDFVKYGGDSKYQNYFEDYVKQMDGWVKSEYSHRKVRAVYAYISQGNVIRDLVNANILPVNGSGQVIDRWSSSRNEERPAIYKVVSEGALSAFVRFDVMHERPDDPVVWEDKELFDAFIRYLESEEVKETGYCYVTGKNTILTTQHGSRIRNAGDMSKLISANDGRGFTYRGRFKDSTQAVQIGYEVSQKAHHALRWLIQRQGTHIASRYFVTFGVEQSEVPEPFGGTIDLIEEGNIFALGLQAMAKNQIITEEMVAEELNKALHGKKHHLSKEKLKNIVVMAVDAATTGRLAIVYYQTLKAELFYDAIRHWHATCRWLQVQKDPQSKQIIKYVGTPSTYRIVEAVYGSKTDSGIKKDLYTRLLPCIVEKKPIPKDVVRTIFNRVKNPFSFEDLNKWSSSLNIACALINKFYESEGYTVALQEDNQSRDYLFGRLLGIAEVMERRILRERNEDRATNATRYFNAFSQHPARTWLVIRKQLSPYFERQGFNAGYYAKLLQQVEAKLTVDKMTNEPLSPIFLLGYSSQIQAMYTSKEEEKDQ